MCIYTYIHVYLQICMHNDMNEYEHIYIGTNIGTQIHAHL